jgi:2,5-diketo-D-gluconate reductase B
LSSIGADDCSSITVTLAAQQCKAVGIAVTVYMPLAKGKAAEDPTIAEIANRLDCEPTVSLAFLLAEGPVVIPASGNQDRMRKNLLAIESELPADDFAKIRLVSVTAE